METSHMRYMYMYLIGFCSYLYYPHTLQVSWHWTSEHHHNQETHPTRSDSNCHQSTAQWLDLQNKTVHFPFCFPLATCTVKTITHSNSRNHQPRKEHQNFRTNGNRYCKSHSVRWKIINNNYYSLKSICRPYSPRFQRIISFSTCTHRVISATLDINILKNHSKSI